MCLFDDAYTTACASTVRSGVGNRTAVSAVALNDDVAGHCVSHYIQHNGATRTAAARTVVTTGVGCALSIGFETIGAAAIRGKGLCLYDDKATAIATIG